MQHVTAKHATDIGHDIRVCTFCMRIIHLWLLNLLVFLKFNDLPNNEHILNRHALFGDWSILRHFRDHNCIIG
jgi:hypothetical protein